MSKIKMNAWQAAVEAFKAEGIKYIFGLPGGDTFYDAIAENSEIQPVLVREESSGVFMAMGYAKITGKAGVCYASSGPGVANLVPGILEAESACVPIIVIAGASNASNAGMGAFQETDQISIVKPITKWSERVIQPERVPWVMRRAFSMALNGKPGPVFVEIPKDIAQREAAIPDYVPAEYPIRSAGDASRIEAAAELLLKSKKPLLVAGGGAHSSRAFDEVKEFAEMLSIPVMTTPSGRGIISEAHPLAFGVVGLYF
ncbi:MAG: thiamine pyrophosphate-binding protein, partial [Candidatus Poribacteria bacterium]